MGFVAAAILVILTISTALLPITAKAQTPLLTQGITATGNPACNGLPEGQLLLAPAPAHQRTSRQKAAEAALARLVACENDADFLTRLGASLNTLGRFEEALEHLERALLLRPDEPLARYSYAWALHELGDSSAVRELLTSLSPFAAPSAQREPLALARAMLLARKPLREAPQVGSANPSAATSSSSGTGPSDPGSSSQGNTSTTSQASPKFPLNAAPIPSLAWGGSRSQWQAQWQLTAGHESNLLGSPRATSLNLTLTGLPTGETVTINVPLDASVRPRPGNYQQALGQLRWQHQNLKPIEAATASPSKAAVLPSAGRTTAEPDAENTLGSTLALLPPAEWRLWQWDTLLALRHRQASAVAGAGFTQADAALDLLSRTVRPTASGLQPTAWAPSIRWPDTYATLGATALNSESGVRYASAQAAAGWQVPWQGRCDLRLGAETQDRRYLSNPVLNGRYTGAVAALRCNPSPWPSPNLQLRAGRDSPHDTARPGSQQQQRGLRAGMSASRWFIEIDHTRQQDASPYSTLIEPGTARRLQRTTARAEWQQPLPRTPFQLVAGAESSLQQSNIVLFDTRNTGVYLALRGAH